MVQKEKKQIDFHSERFVDIPEQKGSINENLKRIYFALDHIDTNYKNKVIFFNGVGGGYEVDYFAKKNTEYKKIIATDISNEAINYCKNHYSKEYNFMVMEGANLAFSSECFDLVFSMEVIEHVHDYEKYLSEIKRVLKPSGFLILSTPNRDIFSAGCEKSPNIFHIKEFTLDELDTLLLKYFDDVEIFGQYLIDENKLRQRLEKNRRVERIRKSKLIKILRTLKIPALLHRVYKKMTKGTKTEDQETNYYKLDDFKIDKENLGKSIWFVAICRKK